MIFNPRFSDAVSLPPPLHDRLTSELDLADRRLSALLPTRPVDVVLHLQQNDHLPISGACFEPGKIDMFIDPSNPRLLSLLDQGDFRRGLYHEYHHALRWGGPGYGATLGEALVSEGLAQHFEQQVEAGPPPVYAAVPKDCDWQAIRRRADSERDMSYDHYEWFHGARDLPNWTGYALGYEMIGDYLVQNPGTRPSQLWMTPAAALFRRADEGILQFPRTKCFATNAQFD